MLMQFRLQATAVAHFATTLRESSRLATVQMNSLHKLITINIAIRQVCEVRTLTHTNTYTDTDTHTGFVSACGDG